MCCFSQPVLRVANTKIFARLTGTGTQLLVYEMIYESETPNAMILPLPVRSPAAEDAMRFISFEGYQNFFEDLAEGFPYRAGFSIGCGAGFDVTAVDTLEVHEVGDYVASFVPSIDDFGRLDAQFAIPKATWNLIPEYADYGFAVFQLKNLSGKPHPMAFEFPTRWQDRIFFPTVHVHDGSVHQRDQFDHALYLQHAGLDSVVRDYTNAHDRDPSTGFVRSDRLVKEFADVDAAAGVLQPELLLHRLDLHGHLPNRDQIFTIAGDPLTPTLNLTGYRRVLPWALVAAATAWFLRRRGRVRRSASVSDT